MKDNHNFIGSIIDLAVVAAAVILFVSVAHKDGYKQGQIDCIEGKIYYQPDTTTNYIKIEP